MPGKPSCGCISWFGPTKGGFKPISQINGFRSGFDESFTTDTSPVIPPAELILDLDFTVPTIQPFPATAAELYALGFGSGLADSIYLCDELAGNMIDHVGANDLVPNNAPLQGRTGLGLFDSGSYTGKLVTEFQDGSGQHFRAQNFNVFDYDANTSFGFLIVFRGIVSPLAGIRYLFCKYAGVVGYKMLLYQNGNVEFNIRSGPQDLVRSGINRGSGGWHAIGVWVDRTAGTLNMIKSEPAMGVGIPTVPLTAGNPSIAWFFALAEPQAVFAANVPRAQIAYFAAFSGAAAEGWNQGMMDAFWNHAQVHPALTTAAHASAIFDLAAAHRVTAFSETQFPIGYDQGLSNARKLGLRSNHAMSTLLTESCRFNAAPWVAVNCNPTDLVADRDDSVRDLRDAQKITATANNGYMRHPFAVAASTEYTMGVYLKRHSTMGGDVSGRLVAYDNTGAAEISAVAFTAGAAWTDPTLLTFTTPVGCVSADIRIEITNNTNALAACCAAVYSGKEWAPINNSNITMTIARTDWRLAGLAGQYVHSLRGEIEAVAIQDIASHGATEYIDYHTGVGNNNRNELWTDSAARYNWRLYDSTGGLVFLITSAAQNLAVEHAIARQWNSTVTVTTGKYARLLVDTVEVASYGTAAWAAINALTNLSLMELNNTLQTNGHLATYRTWNKPRP